MHIAGPSDYLLRKMKFDPHLTHTQKSIPGVPHIKGKIIKLLDNMTGVSLLPWVRKISSRHTKITKLKASFPTMHY